jgi:predicted permease
VDPTNKVMARLSGVILLFAGLCLASLVTWIVARQLTMRVDIERSALLFCAIVAIVAFVCGTIGFRLTFDRPNRYQSLLPPFGWYTMAFVFVLLGSGLGFMVIRREGDYEQLVGAACAIVVARWCWKAGRTATARGRSDAHAS